MANKTQIKLSYFENFYPDEGDFTLNYNLNESKQSLQNKLPSTFWTELRDILDAIIDQKELKSEWHRLRMNGYCAMDRHCCANCCECNCCCTMNCCRFCCCNGECHCCYGDCKSCISYRDYYIGAVVLLVFGVMTIINYVYVNPLAILMIVCGAIMIENHSYSNLLKNEWRDNVMQLLLQNLPPISNKYGVRFQVKKYGFFGVIIDLEITGVVQQTQTVMLMTQPTQTIVQNTVANRQYVPIQQQPPEYNANVYAPPAFNDEAGEAQNYTEGVAIFQ